MFFNFIKDSDEIVPKLYYTQLFDNLQHIFNKNKNLTL